MVFSTTYKNKEYDKASESTVGKPFRLVQRIKQGGIGSGRLNIHTISPKLKAARLVFSEIDYGNIELRPKGIIVHYAKKLERFSWVIPFYRLVIYNAQSFSIHANGHFIRFLKNKKYKENKKFIEKMVQRKNEYLHLEYYDY